MSDIAILILVHNEARHIGRAILSVRDIAKEVFVIDSGSSDDTVAIAQALGAKVLHNKFVNYARQFQWGLDNAPITAAWIMRLDADEVIEADLVAEIKEKVPNLSEDVVGINFNRKHIFMGRWIRYGGRSPLRLLRLWRRGQGRIEDRWMDEHMVVWGGSILTFKGGFSDHNLNDLTYFINKHNKYATREAIDVINQRLDLFPRDRALSRGAASWQASSKRWMKEVVYNRLSFAVAPALYFAWRYFLQLGFLDGRAGLVYHFLQGFWYRFLVGAKTLELERAVRHLHDKQQVRAEISKLTGHIL